MRLSPRLPRSTRAIRPRRTLVAAVVVAVVSPFGTFAVASSAARRTTVSTATSSTLGTYLVSGGRTLYVLNHPTCNTSCLAIWPALTVPARGDRIAALSGLARSRFATTKDARGTWQVTYSGQRLYFFAGERAGTVTGNHLRDKWGTWSIVVVHQPSAPGGAPTTSTPPTTPSSGGTSTTTTTAPSSGGVAF